MAKKLIKNMFGTLVALPLMGASASQVNSMDAGTAKTLAGTAVGFQGVALVGHSMRMIPKQKQKQKLRRKR